MPYEEFIRKVAHQYWDFNEIPLPEYLVDVANYIHDHPDEFKGVVPM